MKISHLFESNEDIIKTLKAAVDEGLAVRHSTVSFGFSGDDTYSEQFEGGTEVVFKTWYEFPEHRDGLASKIKATLKPIVTDIKIRNGGSRREGTCHIEVYATLKDSFKNDDEGAAWLDKLRKDLEAVYKDRLSDME